MVRNFLVARKRKWKPGTIASTAASEWLRPDFSGFHAVETPTGSKVKDKVKIKSSVNAALCRFALALPPPFGAAEERRRSGGLPAHMSEVRGFLRAEYMRRPALPSTGGNRRRRR